MKTLVGYDGDDKEPPHSGNGDSEPPYPDQPVWAGDKGEPPFKGQAVRIASGPFADFEGIVEGLDEEKERVQVRIAIMNRSSLVDLDFSQVKPQN